VPVKLQCLLPSIKIFIDEVRVNISYAFFERSPEEEMQTTVGIDVLNHYYIRQLPAMTISRSRDFEDAPVMGRRNDNATIY
jgi:hypothetical protein